MEAHMWPLEVSYSEAMKSKSCILVQQLSEPDTNGNLEIMIAEIEEDSSDLFSTYDVILKPSFLTKPAALNLAKKLAFERAIKRVAFSELKKLQ
jgi:hypothetical protein